MFGTRENRIGALSGLLACLLVLALTMMAFTALEPSRERGQAINWDAPASEASPATMPLSNR